jgi:hypothetical protein
LQILLEMIKTESKFENNTVTEMKQNLKHYIFDILLELFLTAGI